MLDSQLLACVLVGCILASVANAQENDGQAPIPPSLRQLARRIEPELNGQPQRLTQYVEFFRSELGNDPRLFAFDVQVAQQTDGKVVLTGFVEFPETRRSLEGFLSELGFDVVNELQTLPAAELGGGTLGFLVASNCLSYSQPRGRRSVVSDCLYAEPLYLLREDGDHMLVHSGEGYLGYIPSDVIHHVSPAEFTEYLDGSSVRIVADFKVNDDLMLPTGARLKFLSDQSDSVLVELLTGEELEIPHEFCRVHEPPASEIEKIVDSASQLMDTKYVWGGKSSKGIDCSGLVQVAYATVGWHLPRDSNQQAYLGRLTATRWHTASMRRGDTMYFLGGDGRIRHTAIYLGDGRYINAESPGVRIGSIDPDDEKYSEGRHKSFAFAKRLVE